MKSNDNTFKNTILIFGVSILIVLVAGVSMIMRLTSEIQTKEVQISDIRSSVNQSIISSENKLDMFGKKLSNILETDKHLGNEEIAASDSSRIVLLVSEQQKLIATLLEQNEQIQAQIDDLSYQVLINNDSDLVSSDEPGAAIGGDYDEIRTPEARQEISKLQVQESIRKSELIFQEQVDNTAWSIGKEQAIQATLSEISEKLEHNELNIDTIDCRESMCKLEFNHSNDTDLGNFDIELQFALAQHISSGSVHSVINANGTTSKTFYFSK